jgi:hypothetical protein
MGEMERELHRRLKRAAEGLRKEAPQDILHEELASQALYFDLTLNREPLKGDPKPWPVAPLLPPPPSPLQALGSCIDYRACWQQASAVPGMTTDELMQLPTDASMVVAQWGYGSRQDGMSIAKQPMGEVGSGC